MQQLRDSGAGSASANFLKALSLPLAPQVLTVDPAKPVVDWSLFSPAETGTYAIYRLLMARISPDETQQSGDHALVPQFTHPLILRCRLLGGHFFRISRPLRDIRDPNLRVGKDFNVLETGSFAKLPECSKWCRIEVDPLGVVDSISVYSLQPLDAHVVTILTKIIGLPVAILNNLEARFASGEVKDLLEFFCLPQVQALLTDEVRGMLSDMISDLLGATDYHEIVEKFDSQVQVPTGAQSVSDVPLNTRARYLKDPIIRTSSRAQEAYDIIHEYAMHLAADTVNRFPELARDLGSRGLLKF